VRGFLSRRRSPANRDLLTFIARPTFRATSLPDLACVCPVRDLTGLAPLVFHAATSGECLLDEHDAAGRAREKAGFDVNSAAGSDSVHVYTIFFSIPAGRRSHDW